MTIDWNEFDFAFTHFTLSQVEQLTRQYPDVIAFELRVHCNADYGQVFYGLRARPQNYGTDSIWFPGYANHPPREPDGLAYFYTISEDLDCEPDRSDPRVKRWEAWSASSNLETFASDHELQRLEFLRRACRIVVELEKRGEFDAIRQESSFVVLVEDHDEVVFDSWRRLVEARIEVSPPWASSAAPWPISGRHPEIATAIFVFAMIYRDRSFLHEAAHLLREAIARLPELQSQTSYRVEGTDVDLPIPENNAWARACLALTAEHMWNTEMESRAIERAIEFDPSLPDTYFLRAKMRTRGPVPASDLDVAVADLDLAISLDGSSPDYFGLRANLRARPYYPFLDQAIRDYSRAHELDPFNRQWLMERAAILSVSGETEAAISDYSQVFQLADSVVSWYISDALIERAKCLQTIGRLSEACKDWDRLIEYREAAKYFRGRATCLRALGYDDRATDDEKRAEQLEKSNQ